MQNCQSYCHSELLAPHPTTSLVTLASHYCSYAYEDLVLVYSTYLVASYGMAHRDSKGLSTSFLRWCFPLIFPLDNVNKPCVVSLSPLVEGHVHASKSPDQNFQHLQHLLLLLSSEWSHSLPRPNAAYLWSRSLSYIFNALHLLHFLCPLFVEYFPLSFLAGTYILGLA